MPLHLANRSNHLICNCLLFNYLLLLTGMIGSYIRTELFFFLLQFLPGIPFLSMLSKGRSKKEIFYDRADRKRYPPPPTKSTFHPTSRIPKSSLLFNAALSQNGWIAVKWRRKGHGQCIFETPHNEIKCVLSVKKSKGLVPFTQLVKVRRGKLVLALPSIRFSWNFYQIISGTKYE